MALESTSIERCLEILAWEVRSDANLAKEFEASIEVFFRGSAPGGGENVTETLLAARRHLEWFLVEHHSPSLRGAVAERLEDRYAARVDAIRREEDDETANALEEAIDSLRRSHTGIFDVEEVRAGEGAWLRDLTGLGNYALGDPAMSRRLVEHDLLVGRLYPTGEGLNTASPAVAIVRGANIAGALEADLNRMRSEGAANVIRVSQGELEAMFFGAGTGPSLTDSAPQAAADPVDADPATGEAVAEPDASADPVGDATAALLGAGLDADTAGSALERLLREPRDPERLVHGGGDALGTILEQLAFDTDVDLEAARSALLRAWDLVSTAGHGPDGAAEETTADVDDDAARCKAVDAFAEGRAAGGDAGELVRTLRRDLGLGDEDGDEGDRPAPDFPGVVGAMIDEMAWELGATDPAFDAKRLAPLQHLATFAKPIGVFEELSGTDLLQFATFWLQEKGALTSDEEAVALVHALRRFCDWALDAHEVDVGSEVLDALDGLETSLPRIRRANDALDPAAREAGDEDVGERLEIESIDAEGAASFETSGDRVRTAAGDELTVLFDGALREHLRPGDQIRGRVELDGHALVYRCYPPEAAALTPR
ncbi:MAG: hypothetical protein AAF957_21310 [Planctomycetota bacterium]